MASGELSQAQLLEIFHRDIEPTLSARHQHDNRPKLYMVAAQPGSGKTRAISSILSNNLGTVAEIGDNFCRYHPEYKIYENISSRYASNYCTNRRCLDCYEYQHADCFRCVSDQ